MEKIILEKESKKYISDMDSKVVSRNKKRFKKHLNRVQMRHLEMRRN